MAKDAQIKSVLPIAFLELHLATSLAPKAGVWQNFARARAFDSLLTRRLGSLARADMIHFVQGRDWMRCAAIQLAYHEIPTRIYTKRIPTCVSIICESTIQGWWTSTLSNHDNACKLSRNPLKLFADLRHLCCESCLHRIRQGAD